MDYPHEDKRGAASAGRLVLNDPQAPFSHLTVGLGEAGARQSRLRDWAHDAKHYQF